MIAAKDINVGFVTNENSLNIILEGICNMNTCYNSPVYAYCTFISFTVGML